MPDAGRWCVHAVTKLIYDSSLSTVATDNRRFFCTHLVAARDKLQPAPAPAPDPTSTSAAPVSALLRGLLASTPLHYHTLMRTSIYEQIVTCVSTLAQSKKCSYVVHRFPDDNSAGAFRTLSRYYVSPRYAGLRLIHCKFAMSSRAPMSYGTCARLVSADEHRSVASWAGRRQIQRLMTFVSAACLSAEHRAWTFRSRMVEDASD